MLQWILIPQKNGNCVKNILNRAWKILNLVYKGMSDPLMMGHSFFCGVIKVMDNNYKKNDK